MALVAIVRPPQILPLTTVNTSQGVPSIGVAYLAGSLKAAGHRVVVVDAFGEAVHKFRRIENTSYLVNGLNAHEILDRIPPNVDYIGVSCMYSNEWLYSKIVVRALLERFPYVPVIAGGEHITAEPEYSMDSCPGMLCCVLGEGEETIVDLINALESGRPLTSVDGIAFKNPRGDFVRTKARMRIRQVDQIPLPSWEETPLENYLVNGLGMASIRGRTMPMVASRGCPYKCTFCSNPQMWTQRWIARSPQLVVEEMKSHIDRHKVTHFEFYDLTAIVKREWILEFTDLLLKEKLGVTWALPSGTRSEALDAEIVDRLMETGCHQLCYAPESGSATTLKRIKKQVTLPKMLTSMRASVAAGISIKANIIFGFPGQTLREIGESYLFLVQLASVGVDDVAVFPFVPYPGSELFADLLRNGRIRRDDGNYEQFLAANIYNEVGQMRSWSEHITDRQIKILTVGGMAWFYTWQYLFRPQRALRSAYRLATSQPQTMLERALDGVLRNLVRGRKRGTVEVEKLPTEPRPIDAPSRRAGTMKRSLSVM
jgi:anaerobic magnesium-protoporphyrin IX monomethyl ester cyclase